MANPEHKKWLLEGVEAWNAKRQQAVFRPDLTGLNFREEFQREGKLDSDGQVRLSGIDLSGAKLFSANLKLARLYDANLGAADLTLADLTGAELDGANLKDADLTAAKIQCADLRHTDLIGANLLGTNPWTAYLYPRPDGMARGTPELPSGETDRKHSGLVGFLQNPWETLLTRCSSDHQLVPGETA